jgi:hypothetical protein
VLDNESTPHYSSGMEITPSGLNPASVSPAGNNIDLVGIGLDKAMALGHSPLAWAEAVRAWVDAEPHADERERALVHQTVDEELARVEEAEAEESDGQPDWAQEWHDFDPDC